MAADSASFLHIDAVTRRFGDVAAVDDVSLSVPKGDTLCLLGPSGCGKSTLLRSIAGLETPDAGRIVIDGEDVTALPPHRRPVNMMFQSYALFPHMSVAANIAFGLQRQRLPKASIRQRVEEMLALTSLEAFAARKPQQLSGGQRQRVALARALARHPRVLLLDEPLGALDRQLRERTRLELSAILDRVGVTCVIVTHDQEEALTLADTIAVMRNGRVIQVGSPDAIYDQPADRETAELFGSLNLFATRHQGDSLYCPALDLSVAQPSSPDGAYYLALRPERLRVLNEGERSDHEVQATLTRSDFLGASRLLSLQLTDGSALRVQTAPRSQPQPGSEIRIGFDHAAIRVLPG